MTDTKASNPKEAFGDAKMPLDLMPDTAAVQFNLAFLEGALKYGQYNWRIAGVKTSTYVRAARRHLAKFWNGQDVDPATLVHELASVGACVAIMLDAIACGKLTDDRPPRADMEKALADAAKVSAHLKQIFRDHNPPQYTQRVHGSGSGQADAAVKVLQDAGLPAHAHLVGVPAGPAGTLLDPYAAVEEQERAPSPLPAHRGFVPRGNAQCDALNCWCHPVTASRLR